MIRSSLWNAALIEVANLLVRGLAFPLGVVWGATTGKVVPCVWYSTAVIVQRSVTERLNK